MKSVRRSTTRKAGRRSRRGVGAAGTDDRESAVLELKYKELLRSQVELELSRELYVDLYDSAPVCFVTFDRTGLIREANQPAAQMLGRRQSELVGSPLLVFIATKDRRRLLNYISACGRNLEAMKPLTIELDLARKPGKENVHVELITIPSSNPHRGGKVYKSVFTDITERKQAEESARHLATIVESSEEAIYSEDLDGTVRTWNRAAEKLFGYSGREIIGRSGAILLPAHCLDERVEIVGLIRRGETLTQHETARRRKNGSLVEISLTISPIRAPGGTIAGVSVIARDITRRKRAQQQQQALYELVANVHRATELSELYQVAIDAILKCQNADRASILLYDPDGVMRFKAWRNLSENYRRQVEGRSPWKPDAVDPEPILMADVLSAPLAESLRDIVESEGIRALGFIPITYERRLLGKFMMYYNAPHQFGADEILPAQAIASQVALAIERKRAEQELKSARDEAERSNHAKDEFLAALSHELRTPLNPVLLIASDAAVNPDLPAATRADFDAIRRNVELEARLIDDLLDLTRITRGLVLLEKRVVCLHEILQNTIEIVRREMEEKEIVLQERYQAARHFMRGDPVRLQQIFWNVFKNAIKFTPPKGTITVSTLTPPDSDEIEISVTDTGIGITVADLPRVFDAFAQGEHAGQGGPRRFGGLGLGLAICRKLVELHSGTIEALSEGRDRGATFIIRLPVRKTAEQTESPRTAVQPSDAAPKPEPPREGVRVLVVEDHEPTRRALAELLTRRRFQVGTAGSIREARDFAAKNAFDLLISDIGLPDGSGYDLMKEFRARMAVKGIALTGYGMDDDIVRSQEVGFVTHLTKPLRIQSLESALATAMATL